MLEIGQPIIPSGIATTVEEVKNIAKEIGYPVIVRPAFTLGGSGGGVAYNEEELDVIAKTDFSSPPLLRFLSRST